MLKWLRELDQVLRGEKTRVSDLQTGSIRIQTLGLSIVVVVLGMIYGGCMGTFALLREGGPVYQQFVATAVKVPALFGLTLLITFPSLYVFNALVGSRLLLPAVLRLLVASLSVTLAMLAALGPIVLFFSLSTKSYPFMILLNVFVFGVSGLLGLKFLLQTLHRMTVVDEQRAAERRQALRAQYEPIEEAGPESATDADDSQAEEIEIPDPSGPLDELDGFVLGGHVKVVFRCWVVVFGLVGAQMAWVLRPFIGDPNSPFEWFRTRRASFFEGVVLAVLAPYTALFYASSSYYQAAILFNAVMFGAASLTGQFLLLRFYRPLIRRNERHRWMARVWILVYAFVGIQMGWVLRPFIGNPSEPAEFVRTGAWSNAYVVILGLVSRVFSP